MKFKILQLKREFTDYMFMGYEYAKSHGFSLSHYEEVYDDQMPYDGNSAFCDLDSFLESIFVMFNMDRPDDFKGHSLSVSDLIELEDGSVFYVERFGFEKVSE